MVSLHFVNLLNNSKKSYLEVDLSSIESVETFNNFIRTEFGENAQAIIYCKSTLSMTNDEFKLLNLRKLNVIFIVSTTMD